MITFQKCFNDYLKETVLTAAVLTCVFLKIFKKRKKKYSPNLPLVQLPPFNLASHIHHPSVCRHVSLLQLGEHLCEQFVPKYPSLQARRKNTQRSELKTKKSESSNPT